MRTLAALSLLLISACASGLARAGDTPAPATRAAGVTDDCGGLYALDVRNDGDESVSFLFSDAKQLRPEQRIGALHGKDAATFFFRFPGAPLVWAQPRNGSRVYINDRAAQQRYRIRMTLRCDEP